MNSAVAMMTIPAMVNRHMLIEYLNFWSTFGTSMKKLENSTSLEVAPQDMSISNMWQSRACETCKERPPKKITNMKAHLKFSMTVRESSLAKVLVLKPVERRLEKRDIKKDEMRRRRVMTYTTRKNL